MNGSRFLSFTEYSRENLRAGILWGLFVALLGANIMVYPRAVVGLGEFLTQKSYDVPFVIRDYVIEPDISVTNVSIAYMDEDSHIQLGQSYQDAWDRRVHAAFVDRLREEGAEAVVFDIVFDQEKKEEDAVFAEALRTFGKVVLAADNAPMLQTGHGQQAIVPADKLVEAVTGADIAAQVDDMTAFRRHVGIDEVVSDSDFQVRQHREFHTNDFVYPLSWVAADMLGAPVTRQENAWLAEYWVNYYGPPRQVIANFSYWTAFDTNTSNRRIFSDKVRGRVVFVGANLLTGYSGQRKDSYKSPYPRSFRADTKGGGSYENAEPIPGVEVQATMFLNLLRGDWLTRVHNSSQFWLIVWMGFLTSLGLMIVRPARALLLGGLVMLMIMGLGVYSAIYLNLWFAWLIPVVQVGIGTLGSMAYNGYRLQMHRARLQQSVAMYVSPAVASEVLQRPDMMRPGARKELLSIMFTDIANFTNMSEGMDSDELAHLMNTYFEVGVRDCIHPNQGTVVKFIGDAIFSIWNAPIPQANHRELACRSAIALRDGSMHFEFNKPGLEVLTRIGLHTGTASVGNFGSSNRVDYTALGENINLAARMEGLNKYLGTRILATGDIIKPVQDKFVTRHLGEFQLKGFAKAVEVYELIGALDREEATRGLREEFIAGMEAFKKRDFDAAELCFKRVMQQAPKDGPAKFYLSQIDELRHHPPGGNWRGAIELKEK
jgi:adenylate cyclase